MLEIIENEKVLKNIQQCFKIIDEYVNLMKFNYMDFIRYQDCSNGIEEGYRWCNVKQKKSFR